MNRISLLEPDTRIPDSSNRTLKWTDLSQGDPVIVYFDVNQRSARQIDRVAHALFPLLLD